MRSYLLLYTVFCVARLVCTLPSAQNPQIGIGRQTYDLYFGKNTQVHSVLLETYVLSSGSVRNPRH